MMRGLCTLISRERDFTLLWRGRETAGQALDAVANLKPGLVLADITLPGRNGIELIKDICALQDAMLILVIAMHDEALYLSGPCVRAPAVISWKRKAVRP
jgi:DNA-binding NarL/FixJ family response regulator